MEDDAVQRQDGAGAWDSVSRQKCERRTCAWVALTPDLARILEPGGMDGRDKFVSDARLQMSFCARKE